MMKRFSGLGKSTALVAIGLLALLAAAPPVWAQSDPNYPDFDPALDGPAACLPPLTNYSGTPLQNDDPAVLAARLRAGCAVRALVTNDIRLQVKASAQAERVANVQLLPGGVAPLGTPTWQSIGPTRDNWWNTFPVAGAALHSTSTNGGRIRTVLQDPTNPERVYILSAGGGLWRTDNFSNNKPDWLPLTDAVLSTSGGAVAFGATPNVLYLGIGDPMSVLIGTPSLQPTGFVTGAMVKSVDGGNTWAPFANLPDAILVMDVKVDTTGGTETVFVGTDIGLFRSTDGGVTYVLSQDPAFNNGVVNPQGVVWSLLRTSAGWLATSHGSQFGDDGVRIVLSTDLGATWSIVKELPDTARTTLASAGPGEATVYADIALGGDGVRDVLKSTDGGLTWTSLNVNASKVPTNPNPDQSTMDMGGQGTYNQMILVDPTDPTRNTVWLGGELSTAVTRDGGNTWTLTSNWLGQFGLPYVHADIHTAASVSLRNGTAIVFGTDGGIFVSSDNAKSFDDSKNEGLVTELVYAVTASGTNPAFILAGTQDNGQLLRLPNQTVWNGVLGGDGFGNAWSQANNAVSLGSFLQYNIVRADNNPPNAPSKWSFGGTGIGGLDFYFFATPLVTPTAVADPTGLTFFTSTGLRVWRTQDGARSSWQPIGVNRNSIYPNGNVTNCGQFRESMMGLAVSPTSVNQLAVGCINARVAITTDGGASWVTQRIRNQIPNYGFITTATWGNVNTLYVGSMFNRVVKSTNGGQTWAPARNGFPFINVNKLLADWRDISGNTVYAATGIGVYRTTDGGANWSRFGANMPMVEVSDLHLSADGRLLRAATFGRGVWEIGM